jgi:endonuclease/exonuclease/phosphatase (EEP) superfamily protein YafD
MARVRAGLVWGAWFATAGLAWAAYNRLFVDDRTIPGTAFNAYTFWLFLPAYLFAGAFVALRWWRPAALCGVLAALHVLWVLPLYAPADALPPGVEAAPRLTVVSSNLTAGNPQKERHVHVIRALGADVVLLQEYTAEWASVFNAAGFHESHPYGIEAPREELDRHGHLLAVPPLRTRSAGHARHDGDARPDERGMGRAVAL